MNRIATWVIEREENRVGASLDYLRDIAQTSSPALLKLALLAPFGTHRKRLPKTAYHLARVAVTRSVDCGSRLQIAGNLAVKDGVPRNYLRSVLEDSLAELPPALAEVCKYARSVTEGWDNSELREALRTQYGAEGLGELAFAIASAQVYPTLKRALGHAQRCSTHPVRI